VSELPHFASTIRAIRLVRLLRVVCLLRILRIVGRLIQHWRVHNDNSLEYEEKSLVIYLRMKIDNYEIHRLLNQQKWFDALWVEQDETLDIGDERKLNTEELYKIVKVLHEQEVGSKFVLSEFCLEWLMILLCLIGYVIAMAWLFVTLEFENFETVIEDNLQLKQLVDNALPIRDQIPDVLAVLEDCQGTAAGDVYGSLYSVYHEYNVSNNTFWSELESVVGTYMFNNPWTFEGSIFFVISIITTIGYGSFTPLTSQGQLTVIFCSLPAIYLTIVFGKKNIVFLKNWLCKSQYKSFWLIVFFSVFFLVIFIFAGGLILSWNKDWTLLESIYFC